MPMQSLGYRLPASSRIGHSAPTLLCRDQEQADPETATDWDYNASVGMRLALTVDLAGLLDDCGLGPESEVVAQMTWSSSTTPVRGCGAVVRLADGINMVAMDAPGDRLGGSLTIETRISVRRPRATADFAAVRSGSALWSVRHSVVLEGVGARFPTTAVEFDEQRSLPELAAWSLDLDTDDLGQSSTQAMQLWLNSANPGIASVLSGVTDAGASRIQELINLEVTRRLVMAALDNTDLTDDTETAAGSIGEVLQRLCRALFPDDSVELLRSQRATDAGYLDARLQARLHLFQEVGR